MNKIAFIELANDILNQVGLGPATTDFTSEIAWVAHKRANARQSATTIAIKTETEVTALTSRCICAATEFADFLLTCSTLF